MTLSVVFQLGASLAVVALIGLLVVFAFPRPGWRRGIFLLALAGEAVLIPLRFLASVDEPEWVLADELQLAMFVTGAILLATSDRSRLSRRDHRTSAGPSAPAA